MSGVEQVILIFHLHHRAGADPAVLTAVAGGFQHRSVVLGIGDEISSGRQIDGVVKGITAIFQVVDVIHAVFIVRHGVAHIGLLGAVHFRQEKVQVLVGILLTAGGEQRGKVLVIRGGCEAVAGVLVPTGIQGQVTLDLILLQVPRGGKTGIGVPAKEHIAVTCRRFQLGQLFAGCDGDIGDLLAAVVISFKRNGVRGLITAAQQDAKRHADHK